MKLYKTMRLALVVGAMVASLTSCLNDVNSVFNPGVSPAVVMQYGDSAQTMAATKFGVVYATKLSSYSVGKCLLIDFKYDAESAENKEAQQRGYYVVDLQTNTAVNQQDALSPLTNVNVLLPNEQPVPFAVLPNYTDFFINLNNYLFLPSVCLTTKEQTVNWQLSYNPSQKAVVEDRKSIYSLYLRAFANTGRTENANEVQVASVNAFNLNTFVNDIKSQEGRDADMYLRIHYVNRINPSDSTDFTWGATDILPIK